MPTDKPLLSASTSILSDCVFEFALENGVRVLFAQRARSALVELRLILDRGFAADPDHHGGLSGLATAIVSEGLLRVDDVQVGSALEPLGALLHSQVMPDATVVGLSAFKTNFADALSICLKALAQPEFKTDDLELVRASRLAMIDGERLNTFDLALRVVPPLAYGPGHIYARPFSGSGNDPDLRALSEADVRAYYATQLSPPRIALVVAGSCVVDELRDQLERTVGQWPATSTTPLALVPAETVLSTPAIVVVDRRPSSQTVLAAGLPTVPRDSIDAEPLMIADAILAGMFTSRLNFSLRETKGWTYGVRSSLIDARVQGLWLIRSAVRSDRVAQAIAEIAGEIQNLAGRQPSTADEFSRAVTYLVGRIPSNYETCAQIADVLAHGLIYGLPVSYPENFENGLLRLTPEKITTACSSIMARGALRWMLVGNADKLSKQLRGAIPGEIQVINSASLP